MRGVLLSIIAIVLSVFSFSSAFNNAKKGIIIPAYFYDSEIWDRLIDGKNENVDFIVIVNPNSGPGYSEDPHYTSIINRLNDNGILPIGYVHTSWGSRDIQEVKEEVDRWLELYPNIKGFFFDEAATEEEKIDYYAQLYSYVKEKGNFTVVLNPGTKPYIGYYEISDYIISYESPINEFSGCQADIPEKSGCIVYGASEDDMKRIIKNESVKFFYITDDSGSNPYDTLPSYYEKEISTLAYGNHVPYISGVIIPAYFYDWNKWQRLLSLDKNGVETIVIVNPENGVGKRRSSYYRYIIKQLNQNNMKPIGYVYTNYGRKPLRKVFREIRKWLRWYPEIKGFFIDQVATGREKLRYYRRIYKFIKRRGKYTVVLSPGAPVYRKYYRYADLVITSVNNFAYFEGCNTQIPEKNGCILYNVSYDDMLDKLSTENTKFIYLTDDTDPNPFDQLPSYIEDLYQILGK